MDCRHGGRVVKWIVDMEEGRWSRLWTWRKGGGMDCRHGGRVVEWIVDMEEGWWSGL